MKLEQSIGIDDGIQSSKAFARESGNIILDNLGQTNNILDDILL
jgi:hypothetical protein